MCVCVCVYWCVDKNEQRILAGEEPTFGRRNTYIGHPHVYRWNKYIQRDVPAGGSAHIWQKNEPLISPSACQRERGRKER
jgi:hypothetical protein